MVFAIAQEIKERDRGRGPVRDERMRAVLGLHDKRRARGRVREMGACMDRMRKREVEGVSVRD